MIEKSRASRFARLTGYGFGDEKLLTEALNHPSAVKEGRSTGPDNQRLEYLGDAVLQLAVSHLLMLKYPDAGEGDLSFLRAEMVRRENLADVAEEIRLLELVVVGSSLQSAPRVALRTVAADALEALIGAVYLDGGWDNAYELVTRLFRVVPKPGQELKGSKSSLQELIQARFNGEVPRYDVTENDAGTGDQKFIAKVYHRDHFLGHGTGRSKKRAEEAAALKALEMFVEEK